MMMGGSMMGGAAVMGALMMVAFVVVVTVGLVWFVGSASSFGSAQRAPALRTESPREVLRRRYAAGEITREEFEATRRQVEPAADRPQSLLTAHGESNLELQQLHLELRRLLDQAREAEEQARLAVPDEVQVRAYLETRQGALFRANAVERLIGSVEDNIRSNGAQSTRRPRR